MTDDTTQADELEAGLDAITAVECVRDAVTRADESLVMLDGVPIAGTQGARNAMTATRLTVLERLLEEVRGAIGLERPPRPGQLELGA